MIIIVVVEAAKSRVPYSFTSELLIPGVTNIKINYINK